jgi:hypothetical protein
MKTKWNKYGYQYQQRWYMHPAVIALLVITAVVVFLLMGVLL